jgi:hypothetical protein
MYSTHERIGKKREQMSAGGLKTTVMSPNVRGIRKVNEVGSVSSRNEQLRNSTKKS